jgi:hypothetical protein
MEPNFVIVPQPDLLGLLLAALPEFRGNLDDDDLDFGNYHVYARFADWLSKGPEDDRVWQRTCAFFELLALIDRDILIDVFESRCQNPILAKRIDSNAGPEVRKIRLAMRT